MRLVRQAASEALLLADVLWEKRRAPEAREAVVCFFAAVGIVAVCIVAILAYNDAVH